MLSTVNITIYTVGSRSMININSDRLVTTARDGVYYSRDNTGGVGLCAAIAAQSMRMFHMEQNKSDFVHIVSQICGTAHLKRIADSRIKRRKYRITYNNGMVKVREEYMHSREMI